MLFIHMFSMLLFMAELRSSVYKTSYPIYSTSSYTRGTRVISSPVRIVTSPARVITRVIRSPSPVRITRTTSTRVVTSPEHVSAYTYTTPTTYTSSYIPSTYYSSYTPHVSSYLPRYISSYTPSTHVYTSPSYLYSSPVTRIYSRSLTPVRVTTSPACVTPSYLKRTLPGYGARALTNYLSTEPFTTFREETGRIRNKAQSLIRDLHTPVVRRARSMTPFPVIGYEPTTDVAFDAYVARITNPVRHIAKEIHRMSMYPEPAHKYVGKSHLASVRICGNKAYNVRRPMYDTDKVRTDINLLSWYLRHPTVKKEKNLQEKVESVDTDPELDPYRPSRKFSAPRPLEDPIDDETKEKQRLRKERLMAVNEEDLDHVELEKKKAQFADEAKRREQKALEEELKRKVTANAERKAKEEAARQAEETARLAEEKRKRQEEEEEMKRLAEIEKQAEEALKAAQEAEKKALEEKQKRKAAEEEKKRLEEEAKLAEETRLAEEARVAEEVRLAEEARIAEEAKHAEEAARKAEEASRLIEEQRIREEEINRLAEIEKQAEEEREAELARQAAELAEIARQEGEIAAQELQTIQQSEHAENTASTAEELVSEEPAITEVQQVQEPTIDLNINSGDADVVDTTTEEESEEE